MGAGLVELLAREMTAELQAIRAAAIAQACATGKDASADLVTKGVRFGSIVAHPDGIVDLDAIDGVDSDLIVRPFSRKGVFTSLRQFTINALNIHHGMEAVERFGVRWTGSHDFAESGVPDSITAGDVSALVAFQATLPPPAVKTDLPDDWRYAADVGAKTFKDIGCASCHIETLPLKSLVFTDPAPYDMAGTLRSGEVKEPIRIDLAALPFAKTLKKNDKGEWLIPVYSDLKRHLVVDETINALGNELQAQRFVERDVFLTPRLWGVGSTSPYGHNGAFRMLDEIIAAHGGDARFSRDAYVALEPENGMASSPSCGRSSSRRRDAGSPLRHRFPPCCGDVAAEERPKPLGDVPVMHEEAEAAGVHSVYDGPWEFFVGGGGAALDCDGSGFPSVFLAGGKNPARLYVNRSRAGDSLKFEQKPLDIGADPKMLENVIGAYPIDIDGDGRMDLFVLRVGGNLLLKGGPDCTFTLANHEWGFDGDQGWTTSFAAEWEPGQKFPTLAIGHYVDRDAPGSPWGTCADNSLYRPQAGDKPDYSVRTPLAPGFCALSMLFTDWNKSGVPSLRVSNDRQYYRGGEEQMWRIEPGKTPRLYSRADGWRHLSIYGMGIAEGDLDGSGYPQYFLTSMGDEKLQKLDPDEGARGEAPVYRDIAGEVGATAHIPYAGGDKRPSTAWHAEFADFNNAGLLDIFVSKGNLEQMPDFAAYDPSNLLLGQFNGKFAEAGDEAGIANGLKGRGALIADFNLDGKLDILQVNRGSNVSLYRNLGAKNGDGPPLPMGNWSEIKLIEPNPNRNAVGARITIRTGTRSQTRFVDVGGGDASGHAGFIHVGLGTAERAEIRVKWPDGDASPSYRVFANQFVVIDRTKPQAAYWYPPR